MATGRIQHLCLLTGEGATTPAGLANTITGDYEIDTGALVSEGIGNQRLVLKGLQTAKLTFEAVGMLKSELVKCFPADASETPTALTPMLLVTDTGEAYKLENGVGNATISVAADDNSRVTVRVEAQFGKVSEGTGAPVYLTSIGHQRRHVLAKIDTKDAGMHTFEVGSGVTYEADNNLDTRAAGTERDIPGWKIAELSPTFSCELEAALEAADDFLAGDAVTGEYVPHDIVITLANGTAGENITITLTDWIAPVRKGTLQAQGIAYYPYEWQRGTGTNSARLTMA